MVVSPQRLTRWPSYVRDRHAAITYTTPRDAPRAGGGSCGGDSNGLLPAHDTDAFWLTPAPLALVCSVIGILRPTWFPPRDGARERRLVLTVVICTVVAPASQTRQFSILRSAIRRCVPNGSCSMPVSQTPCRPGSTPTSRCRRRNSSTTCAQSGAGYSVMPARTT
ncbi:hypothetical protein CKJ69_24640 [Mycobacterium avium]|nr:hypothetical protein CKJ69_24640 [Mycobacterium avium]PBA88493.1 hypothetical protein CKJ60_24625 [Mycobacterium avium]